MNKTTAEKWALIDDSERRPCYLDGRRARVVGAHLDFARIVTITDNRPGAEYAWETVARILANSRRFSSK